jgi:lipopolysaccharide export system permease protein
MRFLFSRLSRYLFWRTLQGIGVILGAVSATVLLVDLVEQMRTVGARANLTILDAVTLTALKAPSLIEQTLPFVALVGVMIALIQLNRKSELVAVRASGVSAWRFLAPPVVCAAMLGLFSSMALNPIGAAAYEQFEKTRNRLLNTQPATAGSADEIWLRQGDGTGQIVIHAKTVDPRTATLNTAVLLYFELQPDGSLGFTRRLSAESAVLRPGFWQLAGVVEAAPGMAPVRQDFLAIPTSLKADALFDRIISPQTMSFWRLPSVIHEAKAAGLTPTRFDLRWHTLLSAPLLLAAMAALAAVFSLRLQRLSGQNIWIMTGLAAGFALFFGSQFSAAFASAEVVPPALAAWSAPIAGFFAAMAVLGFVEDG